MTIQVSTKPISKASIVVGYGLSTLSALFMLMDGVMKLFKPAFIVEATTQLGFSEAVVVPLGIVLTVSTLLYILPKTSILGAILLTGYLGGAVATHVHAGHGAFEMLFPAIFGVFIWGGLVLRNPVLRMLLPFQQSVSLIEEPLT